MRKDNYYNNIEDYILGRMPPDEIRRFEEQIRKNPGLNEDVNLYRDIITATGKKNQWEFRNKLDRIYNQDQKKTGSRRVVFFRRLLILPALLAILAIILILIFKPQQEPLKTEQNNPVIKEQQDPNAHTDKEKKIAAEQDLPKIKDEQKHNSNLPVPETAKTIRQEGINYTALAYSQYRALNTQGVNKSPQEQRDNLGKAWQAFAKSKAGNKPDTTMLNQVISLLDPPDSTNLFDCLKLRANAYFMTGNFEKAAQDFQSDIFTGTAYQYNAEWNLLLCQLALLPKNRDAFDRQLGKIINRNTHAFRQDAALLKEKLITIETGQ
ncbi:MAG: hypothetical protein KDC85_21240 [Saprospiraceae bacterium]|nr:hypothetical protein [Lewinella sp.]MCB0653816.1 hypothetical protein [Saprospiraceae bacterium]MCB9277457.1 hypothetical protein [Lewinellaceae bacterium]